MRSDAITETIAPVPNVASARPGWLQRKNGYGSTLGLDGERVEDRWEECIERSA